MYIWVFSRSEGAGKATTLNTRGTHPLGDRLDGAALAGGVATLEQDDDALPRGLDPFLQGAQFRLQFAQLLFVILALELGLDVIRFFMLRVFVFQRIHLTVIYHPARRYSRILRHMQRSAWWAMWIVASVLCSGCPDFGCYCILSVTTLLQDNSCND